MKLRGQTRSFPFEKIGLFLIRKIWTLRSVFSIRKVSPAQSKKVKAPFDSGHLPRYHELGFGRHHVLGLEK